MKKLEMICQIRTMVESMEVMIQRTGLKRNLLQIHKDVDRFSMVFIRGGYNWIKIIFNDIHFKCIKIRRMCTEEQWTSYKALSGLDTDELTEVVQMNKVLAKLRKAIASKNRPDFFKREAQRVEAKLIKKHKIKKT